jgi:predicted DNA-binding protein (UPF0251 family)
MSAEDDIEQLADAGLLTERQAEAFVFRDVEVVPRQAAADSMGISVNTLDKRLAEARGKVEDAEATVDALREIRHEEFPSECSECGATLGGRWAEDDDGRPFCMDCSGVEG